ncbi:hypothetical protein B1759_13570 [Rubrivirga sp. SAORIC476]|uniref:hypothetical protein n=1 Tax=Rubrivirga sp. SAORIC476 TaxID=1961794 RepID=UPI000BA8F571|nr:hypothetical protein [Rubrivirga sp. SAORIC476]PAP79355.1 hypothetical protein B1759_13570 [Rubrivirga sp. SAORIC476]
MRLVLLALALTSAAAAQPGWRAIEADSPTFSVDVLTAVGDDPSFLAIDEQGNPVGEFKISTLSMSVLLAARVPVGDLLTVVGEVPFAYVSYDYPEVFDIDPTLRDADLDDIAFGNPYLGVEVQSGRDVTLGAGVRLPLSTTGDFAIAQGWQAGLATEVERFEAYLPDTFTASASVAVAPMLSDRVRVRARVEPALLVPTGDNTDSGVDLALGGSIGLDAALGRATLSGGFLTRRTLTDGRFGGLREVGVFEADATALLGATLDLGRVRPGLDVRVPLYDTTLQQDATIGLRVDVAFP